MYVYVWVLGHVEAQVDIGNFPQLLCISNFLSYLCIKAGSLIESRAH